jgi:hypothetical protein
MHQPACARLAHTFAAAAAVPAGAGSTPYMPKARVIYQALEVAVQPKQRNIVTAEDGPYWKAVRQGTAPCFSMNNFKKVRSSVQYYTASAQASCRALHLVSA